jgi:ribosomal protein L1
VVTLPHGTGKDVSISISYSRQRSGSFAAGADYVGLDDYLQKN